MNSLGEHLKRKAKIIVLLAFGLLTVCWFAPYLIQTDTIRATITDHINTSYDASTTIQKIRWRWLPLPHVTLYDSHIKTADFNLILPKARIYPNWSALFNQKLAIGRIYIKNPDVTISSSFYDPNNRSPVTIPRAHLVIHGGTFRTYIPSFKGIHFQNIKLLSTSINMHNNGDNISFTLLSGSSFADTIRMSGNFEMSNLKFSGKTNIKNFNLQNLITADNPFIKPLSSTVDFDIDFIGKGSEELQFLYSGNFPDFSLQRLEESAPFHFSNAHFIFDKKIDSTKLKVLNMEIDHPNLQISGEIERYFSEDKELPFYRLDLAGTNIDLSGVRTHILYLLGDSSVTQQVCDIVRGGEAESGSYFFDGPSSDFSFIESMTIKANVTSSYIYVPEVDLHLKKTSGPISILNGDLTGSGLKTWLGNSYGSNGELLLGLGEDNWAFKLDVIVDADISELPSALHKLIESPHFREEITRFSGLGRTKGHLVIGDDIRDFSVKIAMDNVVNTIVHYNRIPWPIKLTGGSLKINGNNAVWEGITANVGPHLITEVSGSSSWESDDITTDITSISGTVNSEKFLEALKQYPSLSNTLDQKLETLNGPITIDGCSIQGPLLDPAKWTYICTLGFNGADLTSPLFPGTVSLNQGTAMVQKDKIQLSNILLNFLNSSFELSAKLTHSDFHNWQGSLSTDGLLTGAHANWLRSKRLLPDKFVPATPSLLESVNIHWDDQNLSVQGTVTNKILTGKTAKAKFVLKSAYGGMIDLTLDIDSEDEQGKLSIMRSDLEQPLRIGWNGVVSQPTLSALLAVHYIHSGRLDGNFMITLPSAETSFAMKGNALITDLQRVWGEQLHQVSIQCLKLTGEGNELFINDMDLEYQNESAIIKGKLFFKPDTVYLDIQQQASFLSEKKLSEFIDDLSHFFSNIEGPKGNADILAAPKTTSTLTGAIKIQADSFELDTGNDNKPDKKNFIIQPLQANVDLSDPSMTIVNVDNSKICGLPIQGTLKWSEIFSQKDFSLKTSEDKFLAFENFLPCLGTKKKFIEGEFSVEGTLKDVNGDLTEGTFSLHSTEGTLWRLVFLSKIFQLVNFTDLYNGLFSKGLPYTLLDLNAHIEDNLLIFDKAVIEGEGLDLVIKGSVNLINSESNMTVFIVPLKTVDTIISSIPLIGKTIIRLVGGRKGHIITIPVSVTGDIKDPEVKLLPAKAVGKAAVEWLLDTVTYPMEFIPGVPPISEGSNGNDTEENTEEENSGNPETVEEIYDEG